MNTTGRPFLIDEVSNFPLLSTFVKVNFGILTILFAGVSGFSLQEIREISTMIENNFVAALEFIKLIWFN